MRRRQALIEADEKRMAHYQPPAVIIQTETRHKCPYCTRDFASQTGMYIHLSRLHQREWQLMKDNGEV